MAALLPLQDFLDLSTLTLASAGSAGEPHAAAVFFAADDRLNLYFYSDPSSQHAQDIEQNPSAAVTIQPPALEWQEIRGLQLRGKVHRVKPGPAWEQAWQLYLAKFPFVAGLSEVVSRTQLYVFKPDWVRLLDNRQVFGFKQEWVREPATIEKDPGWRQLGQGEARG